MLVEGNQMVNSHLSDRQGGMALLEAMIAVAVLSFGLLGLAGLQIAGIKSNQVAFQRSVATMQAYDMADRMRAGMDPSAYKALTTVDSAELSAWKLENGKLLPGGSGTVFPVGNHFVITVTWTEKCQTGEAGCSSGKLTRTIDTEFLP
jgi:type IV pilus assembly protein PilV